MALVTRCRSCGTAYKVYPEQLQAQNGFVRCGACRAVFNGFATLITVAESEIAYASAVDPQNSTLDISDKADKVDAVVEESAVLRSGLHFKPEQAFDNVHGDHPGRIAHIRAAIAMTTSAGAAVPAGSLSAVTMPGSTAPVTESITDFLSEAKLSRPPADRAWIAASIFLCFLLVGQGIYAYRTDLTILFPQSRSFLEQLCKPLGCAVPLPAHIQQLSIVFSDLEVRDPVHYPEVLTLTTIIRNHAVHAQALPAIKLSLTDVHNQLLASRIFTADEYLSREQGNVTAIQHGQELAIQLYLDNSDLNSKGYQVELLYL